MSEFANENSHASLSEDKHLTNPFSAGSGGPWFEVQVMSAFAVLMLAGGFAPCLPCLPITSIKLQERKSGYCIDDFVVYVSDVSHTDKRRLLAQVKHGISFTKSNKKFRETIAAAWKDFNNAAIFTRKKDAIAIIAGPLSATDIEDTRKILEWSRSWGSADEFFKNVDKANFSSDSKREKLAAFCAHVKTAANAPIADEEIFEFLRHLHVLGFDLDVYSGITHALLHGIIGRHNTDDPAAIWARILQHVASFNPNAGSLTVGSFPDDVQTAFKPHALEIMPPSLAIALPPKTTLDWDLSDFPEALTVANLLGGWQEGSAADIEIVAMLTSDQPGEWLRKMREVLQRPDSPLSHADGIWTVKHRTELWRRLASRIFNDSLKRFAQCAAKVLTERDPKFELEPEQRFAAQIRGKSAAYSWTLRNGIADTLAILGTSTMPLQNCALSDGEATATLVMRTVFEKADWKLWASVDLLIPTLAESAPNAFLDAVEKALASQPSPFDAIFAEERPAFTGGGTYITGLLWGLETLAWDEKHIVRVSVILAMLAARDPGGNWGNRPANSLTTIFLPWHPQTRASIEKRTVAVRTIVKERPEVGWRLLLNLFPTAHGVSKGTHKPKWRDKLGADEDPRPTIQEYWDQVSAYVQMAIEFVQHQPNKLKELIDTLDTLPEPELNRLLNFLESETVAALPDEVRLPIWTKLSSFARKHKRYTEATWALPPAIVEKIEKAMSKLAPQDPTVKHRFLFSKDTWQLTDDDEDWQKGAERLAKLQVDAIQEIYGISGLDGVLSFAARVEDPSVVGFALGKLESVDLTNDLIPRLVLSSEPKWRDMVQGFIWAMQQRAQWAWFDRLNTDSWQTDQIAQLLTYLPFDAETWKRASQRLGNDLEEYWMRVPIHRMQSADSDYVAVDALLKYGRPRAAAACLAARVHGRLPIDSDRAIDALLRAVKSTESSETLAAHDIEEIIRALQDDHKTDNSKLMQVEWAYLALLEHSAQAKALNAAMAADPKMFCEIIRMIFRSDRKKASNQTPNRTEEQQEIAMNAYRLLQNWSTIPGTDASGQVSLELLTSWIDSVKCDLEESGHLDIGLQQAGEVFIHAPADSDLLFIDHAAATVLNREDMEQLRRGYSIAVYNSRGVHFVDPKGGPEMALSSTYNQRADAVENAGYHRLAITLRTIADGYTREANQLIARSTALHQDEGW